MKWKLYKSGTMIPEGHPQKEWLADGEEFLTTIEVENDCEAMIIRNKILGFSSYKPMEGCDCGYCRARL